jgi:transcriptional regulator of acetoin/glycerol metabolism
MTEAALRQLMAYPWPGNVRELKSAIEYAAIRCMSTTIDVDDLPPEVQAGASVGAPPAGSTAPPADERSRIVAALAATHGNRKEAARHLGISRATLYRRLAELGIGSGDQ